MYKFIIKTEYRFKPYKVNAYSYKFKRGFLTLDLTNGKKIVFNVNKVELIEMEETVDE